MRSEIILEFTQIDQLLPSSHFEMEQNSKEYVMFQHEAWDKRPMHRIRRRTTREGVRKVAEILEETRAQALQTNFMKLFPILSLETLCQFNAIRDHLHGYFVLRCDMLMHISMFILINLVKKIQTRRGDSCVVEYSLFQPSFQHYYSFVIIFLPLAVLPMPPLPSPFLQII
jgi:hypothetical protein